MSNKRILILDNVNEICAAILTRQGFDVEVWPEVRTAELLQKIHPFHGLIVRSATQVTAELLQKAANLQVVGRAGVGLDNIDVEAARQKNVAVFNAAAANTLSAAEHTLALMLSLARQIPQAQISMLNGKWDRKAYKGVELFQKTLGIIGLGRIGQEVARRARAFEMRILAHDPWIESEVFKACGARSCTLEELLHQSDFVTVHVPLLPSTRYLLGQEQFDICKNSLRLINVARGGIVDEQALYQALRAGKIAGAAMDVFETEPPVDNPLIGMDKVVVTPHLGASTHEGQSRVAEEIAKRVANFLLKGA